eukprot:948880-Pleurochrysis_carterae.AAC.1
MTVGRWSASAGRARAGNLHKHVWTGGEWALPKSMRRPVCLHQARAGQVLPKAKLQNASLDDFCRKKQDSTDSRRKTRLG